MIQCLLQTLRTYGNYIRKSILGFMCFRADQPEAHVNGLGSDNKRFIVMLKSVLPYGDEPLKYRPKTWH